MRIKYLFFFKSLIKKITIENLIIIFCIPLVALTRLLKPLVHIRFGIICVIGIGDLISGCWDYEAKNFLKIHPKRSLDLFFFENNKKFICNNFLLKYFLSNGNYLQHQYVYYLWRANLLFKDYKKYDCMQINYFQWPAKNTPTLFFLSTKQKQTFYKELSYASNIYGDFVCFHSRDSDYKKAILSNLDKNKHEFSHQEYRNSDFNKYNKSATYLDKYGIKSIRVGNIAHKKISSLFWDYSNSTLRNEKNDVLICNQCKFWVMTTSGISWIPQMFGKPGVAVNLIPFTPELLWHYPKGTVVLPKKILNRKGNPLSLEEVASQEPVNHDEIKYINKYFEREGITFLDNSEQEIFEAVKDYYEINITKTKKLDIDKQYNFWKKLYPDIALDLADRLIISPSYFKRHANIN